MIKYVTVRMRGKLPALVKSLVPYFSLIHTSFYVHFFQSFLLTEDLWLRKFQLFPLGGTGKRWMEWYSKDTREVVWKQKQDDERIEGHVCVKMSLVLVLLWRPVWVEWRVHSRLSLFRQEVDFRLRPGFRISIKYGLVFVHPSYHCLSANWSREDKLQLKDDCQRLMIGQTELQAAAKAQRLRKRWCCGAEEREQRDTHIYKVKV